MIKILISHPLYHETIKKLGLTKITTQDTQFAFLKLEEDLFYTANQEEEILYIPSIATKQIADEEHDPSLMILRDSLVLFKPHVLIVGNNAVKQNAMDAWRQAVGNKQKLLIIRRGVDTRAIDKISAQNNQIFIDNLPGINSPYVAEHMLKYIKLNLANKNSKIGIIGVGNIGKIVALQAIKLSLNVCLFSPSLQDPNTRLASLRKKGISPEKVTCASSLEEAFSQANFVAIAIPLYRNNNINNQEIITENQINLLAKNSRIVSVSVPSIFTQKALELMNKKVEQKEIYVRIDTPKRHVETLNKYYPNLDAAHDQAFASRECQSKLDCVMFAKLKTFFN
jgi:lactate dehydrogenase-like 2-hydroxyacid dehydrogenase